MPRNAHAQSLYVSHIPALSEYNAITGELIDANFITGVDPFALVVDESEQYLFVGRYPGSVGKYEPTTERPININFITGLNRPSAFALLGDKLFVVDETRGTVDVYDTGAGKVINPYRFAVLGAQLTRKSHFRHFFNRTEVTLFFDISKAKQHL